MKLHNWKDIRDRRLGPEEKAQVRIRASALRQELGLRAIRESLGMTQNDVAGRIEVDQGQLSRFERGQDMRLSTLRRYLGACDPQGNCPTPQVCRPVDNTCRASCTTTDDTACLP